MLDKDRAKDLADFIKKNTTLAGGIVPNSGKLDMFDFDKMKAIDYYGTLVEPILTRSNPYYVLIEYQVKEKIDILYGMEMTVTKRKGLALDLDIPDNAKAQHIMTIVDHAIYAATGLKEFTILTINDL